MELPVNVYLVAIIVVTMKISSLRVQGDFTDVAVERL